MAAVPGAQRVLGALVHLSPLAVAVLVPSGSGSGLALFVGPLGPLVFLLVVGRRPGFLRRHGVGALNLQVLAAGVQVVVTVVGLALILLTAGLGLFVVIPVYLAVALGTIGLQVVAAVRAGMGYEHPYPWPGSRRPAG